MNWRNQIVVSIGQNPVSIVRWCGRSFSALSKRSDIVEGAFPRGSKDPGGSFRERTPPSRPSPGGVNTPSEPLSASRRFRGLWASLVLSGLVLVLIRLTVASAFASGYDTMYEQAPINYSKVEPVGPVAQLQAKLNNGEIQFDRSNEQEFLRALLDHFEIPIESQVLVYSKTSHQNSRIHPETPRAVYFNDDVYVGWVQGGVVEIADMNPTLGMSFYVLDHRDVDHSLKFERTATCLDCHAGSRVNNMPGLMVRSVYPAENGQPILRQGSFVTTHSSPLKERWGGWYVTGTHGGALHMGNAIAEETDQGAALNMKPGANVTELSQYFDTEPYLTDSSDIVALMVLEHQCEMQNVISRAANYVRLAIHRQKMLREELGEPPTERLVGSSLTVANSQAEKILKNLLFTDEIMLPDDGITGREGFQEGFQRNARRDGEGRSLKDFQLKHRLFKYRCSYMIYSAAFEDLPKPLKDIVYARLNSILEGDDDSGDFSHLTRYERVAIKEILSATKNDLPSDW